MLDIFYFDKELKKGSLKELSKVKGKPLWIDITNIKKDEAEAIGNIFGLHALTVEDILTKKTRIKIETFNDYMLCVFYGIRMNKELELVEFDFVIGKDYIISNHFGDAETVNELKRHPDRIKELLQKGPEFLFHRIIDAEVDNYFPVLENIDEQIENIEERVTKRPEPALMNRILKIKRSIIFIKKSAMPQREKIGFLAKNDYPFISKRSVPYFRDLYDHSIRISDAIENYREAIGNTFDVYMSAVSNSTNEVMKVLSMIATIALPLTVISGIYGTNFLTLPGSKNNNGFWIMLTLMSLMVIGMVYFFRKRRWF